MIRWYAELYSGKPRTATTVPDATFSASSKAEAISGIMHYVLTMTESYEGFKIIVKPIGELDGNINRTS